MFDLSIFYLSLQKYQIFNENNMKNLKKLSKGQLKSITGAGIKLPEPEFCMYACGNVIICATCSKDFKCPDDTM